MLKKKFKEFIFNVLLVLCSIFIALVIIEISLRIFFPAYQEASESNLKFDDYPQRIPNTHCLRKHPDTRKKHLIVYNNLGLRQSWDVFLNPDKARLRVGIFGDSFVENTGLSVEYGFVDVLDYLLNSNEDKFEVINFGMNAYGTDDCYLSFLKRPVARNLSFIFNIVSSADLMRIYENKLISIDKNGRLVFTAERREPSFWKTCISKLYLTYFFLEARAKFLFWLNEYTSGYNDRNKLHHHSLVAHNFQENFLAKHYSDKIYHVIKIYKAILQRWSQQAALQHSQFVVVLLPFYQEAKDESLIPHEVDRINLHTLLKEFYPTPPRLRFHHDGHWNEAGNMIAAAFLYRYLEAKLNLPHRDDDWVKQRLFEYYSAFDGEWFPDFYIEETPLYQQKEESIWNKYKALEIPYLRRMGRIRMRRGVEKAITGDLG